MCDFINLEDVKREIAEMVGVSITQIKTKFIDESIDGSEIMNYEGEAYFYGKITANNKSTSPQNLELYKTNIQPSKIFTFRINGTGTEHIIGIWDKADTGGTSLNIHIHGWILTYI